MMSAVYCTQSTKFKLYSCCQSMRIHNIIVYLETRVHKNRRRINTEPIATQLTTADLMRVKYSNEIGNII